MPLSVELDDQTASLVQELATTQQRSPVQVIQAALAAYAGIREWPLPKGAGKYHSGHADTSTNVDAILANAVKDGLWP